MPAFREPAPPCPRCGDLDVQPQIPRRWSERLAAPLGLRPHRCLECGARFMARTRPPSRILWIVVGVLLLGSAAMWWLMWRAGATASPPSSPAASPAPARQAEGRVPPLPEQDKRLEELQDEVRRLRLELRELQVQAAQARQLGRQVRQLKHDLDVAQARAALADRLQEELARMREKLSRSAPAAPAASAAPLPPPQPARSSSPGRAARAKTAYYIQVGSFATIQAARKERSLWRRRGLGVRLEKARLKGGRRVYRVLLGPWPDAAQAKKMGRRLKARKKIQGYLLRKRRRQG